MAHKSATSIFFLLNPPFPHRQAQLPPPASSTIAPSPLRRALRFPRSPSPSHQGERLRASFCCQAPPTPRQPMPLLTRPGLRASRRQPRVLASVVFELATVPRSCSQVQAHQSPLVKKTSLIDRPKSTIIPVAIKTGTKDYL